MTTIDRPAIESLLDLDASIADVADATTLPPELYTSPEVLAFEREAVYAKEWLCVGRAERIPEVGDWFTVTIMDEPIIVVRDKGGEVGALSAVCQHRAMQVCDGQGNSTTFKCPYHHWNYGLDGRLLGAPAMERTEEFDKGDWGCRCSPSRSGRASCSSTSTPMPRRSGRRWRSTNRSSPTTTSPAPSARARSRSRTCRGTGR
jgi:nitrite reductase/ring-hydroxylating ferredoxin subunit